MADFASRLQRLRKTKGVSLYWLAQVTGISKQGMFNLERPDADPKLSTIKRLAEALGVSVAELVDDDAAQARSTGVDRRRRRQPPPEQSLAKWAATLNPMLGDLIREAHKNRDCISLTHLRYLVCAIRKTLEAGRGKVNPEMALLYENACPLLDELRKHLPQEIMKKVERLFESPANGIDASRRIDVLI